MGRLRLVVGEVFSCRVGSGGRGGAVSLAYRRATDPRHAPHPLTAGETRARGEGEGACTRRSEDADSALFRHADMLRNTAVTERGRMASRNGWTVLVAEQRPLALLLTAREFRSDEDPEPQVDHSPELTQALLEDAKSETLSQPFGSRAVKRAPRLAWNSLVSVYGSEANLLERIAALRAVQEVPADLLELVDKYAAGWRPEDMD